MKRILMIAAAIVVSAMLFINQTQTPVDLQSQKLQAAQGVNAANANLKNIQAEIDKNNSEIAAKEAERVRLQNQKASDAALEKLRAEIEQKRIANAMLQAQFEAQIEQDKIAAQNSKTEADKNAQLAALAVIVAQNKAATEQAIEDQKRMTIEQQEYEAREKSRLAVQQAIDGARWTAIRDGLVYAALPAVIVLLVAAFGFVFVVRHWQMAGANIQKKRAEAIAALMVLTHDGVYLLPSSTDRPVIFTPPQLMTAEENSADDDDRTGGIKTHIYQPDDRKLDDPFLSQQIGKLMSQRTPTTSPTPHAAPIVEPAHDPFTKKVICLLDASIAKHGKGSPYIASDDAIEWDGRDWQPVVDALKSAGAVVTQGRGRPAKGAPSRTRVSEKYQSLSALREAVETGGLIVSPPLSVADAMK